MHEFLELRPEHMEAMRQYVSDQAPIESCGLLAGRQDSVETVIQVRNAEQSPVRFRMDAQDQYNAFMWIEENGLDLIGIFHSHPSGPATVSGTDIAEAAYDVIHVVWSPCVGIWSARGFRIHKGQAAEVELKVITE